MKKIYSFMLMATMLLIGINANAVNSEAELRTALNNVKNAATDEVTIVIDQDFSIYAVIRINLGTKTAILDLNGHTLSAGGNDAITLFELYKGNLLVTGTGSIDNTGSISGKNSPVAFKVFGTYEPVLPGNYTHLTIDENVQINVAGGVSGIKGYGISINELSKAIEVNEETMPKTTGLIYNRNTTTATGNGFANGVRIDVKGDISMTSDKGYCVKTNGNLLYAGNYVPHNNSQTQALIGHSELQLDSAWADYAPFIKLHSTAYLHATATGTGAAAIYSSGYASYDIQCEADGATALFAKSGNVVVTDAVLRSTADTYSTTQNSGKSGVNSQGSAIVIESNGAYQGEVSLTIQGDTRVEANKGCAIEEVVTTATETHVSAVNIEGGAFASGDATGAACIKFDAQTLIANESSESATTITIGGGSYSPDAHTASLLDQILAIQQGEQYTTEVTNAAGNVVTALVVTTGTTPAAPASTYFTSDDLMGYAPIYHSGDTMSVKLDSIDAATLTLSDNLVLGNLQMNCVNAVSIVIPDGLTLKVKKLIMNANANITVEAGGKLIVYGEQGMYTSTYGNLVIEAQEGKSATFLIHPAVTSNKHPQATVEFISKAFDEFDVTGKRMYQRFGIPTHEKLTSLAYEAQPQGSSTVVFELDIANDEWVRLGRVQDNIAAQLKHPFSCYEMISNNTKANRGLKYIMTGELVGNGDAVLPTPIKWGTYANSYLANIDLREFIEAIPVGMAKAMYIYKESNNDTYTWEPVDDTYFIFNPEGVLPALQAFILNKQGSAVENVTLDYKATVYNPAMGIVPNSNEAPARRAQMDITAAMIAVSNAQGQYDNIIVVEGDQFSATEDRGYDTEKFMNEGLNLYITADEKMAHYASDNLANTYIGIAASKAGMYTLRLENMIGEGLAIVDLTTGARMDLTQGAEYTFQVAANEANDYRFQIVESAKMPTDVEVIEAVAKKAGIYTLTGQYLGNASKWNTLPAGIYVVDGVKKVK